MIIMLYVKESSQYKKDFERAIRQGKKLELLEKVLILLLNRQKLPLQYYDHKLSSNYKNFRECHIQPDWLLIYRIEGDTLFLARLGSHSQLFK